jgi:hypothetical protein
MTHPPEVALILQAVRPQSDADTIRQQAAAVQSWERVAVLAQGHGVAPLTVRGLDLAGIAVPPRLHQAAESAGRRALLLAGELARISAALEKDEVPCLAVKGAVESALVYGGPALRSFSDIDLVVCQTNAAAAAAVLQDAGYRLTDGDALADNGALGQAMLQHREHGAVIDLHWRWSLVDEAFALPVEEAMRHPLQVRIAGQTVQTLADKDRLLFLCMHGGRHRWERLSWLCDLAWESAAGRIDENLMLAARQRGVSRALHLGLALAVRLLGVAQPRWLPATLPPTLRPLAGHAMRGLQIVPRPDHAGRLQALLGHMILHDTWHGRLNELRRQWRRHRPEQG